MASRPLMIASMLGATIGVPYLASRSTTPGGNAPAAPSHAPPAASVAWPSATTTGAPPFATTVSPSSPPIPAAPVAISNAPLGGVRYHKIEHVLRFDLTKEWVYANWNRKSTGPTDVGLLSVRVPLVTGTEKSALAGSLTYFFNSYNQVEHITFRGKTGDPSQLISFLMRTYEFQPASSPFGEQLYQVTYRDRPQSELVVRSESILKADAPNNNVAIELELARPGTKRFLPPRSPQLQVPPAPAAPTPPPANESAAASSDLPTSGSEVIDRFRYATPQEESQVLWKRWPN